MKYYTYQEHHIFCVESGIDSCLLWRQIADLDWLPEGIYHNPDNAFNPERKAKAKEYRSPHEHKAKQVDRVKKWRKANPGKRKVWDDNYRKKIRAT